MNDRDLIKRLLSKTPASKAQPISQKKEEVKEVKEVQQFKASDSIRGKFHDDHLTFDTPSIFLFLGKAGTGKSYCCKYILQRFIETGGLKKSNIFAFTQTKFNSQYSWLGDNVTTGYDTGVLKNIMYQIQAKRRENGNKIAPVVLIFDDIMGAISNLDRFIELKQILTTFRHYNISIMICQQYAKGAICTPTVREQIRYVFAFSGTGKQSEENIYDAYAQSFFDSKKEFVHVLRQITGFNDSNESHRCMLIDTAKKRRNDAIIGYRAGAVSD